jgi:GTP-binding protein
LRNKSFIIYHSSLLKLTTLAEQNFIDYIRVFCRSGKGGAGASHFYRDAMTDKGGPDGGDGGKGGAIIVRGNSNMWTLLHLRYRKHLLARDGVNGSGKNCTGATGEDVMVDVPLGTIIIDEETGEKLGEITEHGETKILYEGGRGGQGNQHYVTSTNQVPRKSQPGEMGREGWVTLELKVLADVGLVGFPNAGKSTLLSVLSAAKPQIADYPFTTLVPNLGIVSYRGHRSFIMADIPGIIENAHEGKGLGHRFLRHIERNAVLLFMIPSNANDILKEYHILVKELEMYNPELLDKPRVIAITKTDLIDDEIQTELIAPELPKDVPHIFISAVMEEGLTELKDLLWKILES